MSEKNVFEELNSVNCSANVEKKGGFSYLSWPFAVGELLKRHPDSTWLAYEFDGCPYKDTPAGCFVKVGVTVNGIERTQWHPVLDNTNRTIKEPNAFQVNTSIQRALVKAIALHGLGLYIYAGEDLPSGSTDPAETSDQEPVSIGDMKAKLVEWLGKEGAKAKWKGLGTDDQTRANKVFFAKTKEELGL